MPLQEKILGAALGETLTRHSTLCRREVGAFQAAVQGGGEVVVACTQEKRLFAEVDAQTAGASATIRFVNIRETGGWSRDAAQAMPKIAALLAAARLPEPEPVATVTYKSQGRLLIIGALPQAEQAAALLGDAMDVTVFTQGGSGAQERRFPVLGGQVEGLSGWLGAFSFKWSQGNPIDLDLCTRCNACVAVCPEGAIGLDYQIDLQKCTSHRACLKACEAAGAIDFTREPQLHEQPFDLVLDLRAEPAFAQHAPPQGYFFVPPQGSARAGAPGAATLPDAIAQLRDRVGEFEKPKFFAYKQKLCAHSRNETVGCSACIEVCSASAISSEKSLQRIVVNANLCVGCGACTTVCPTGALTYAYPRAGEQGDRFKTLLSTYAAAGGRQATLLLHSQERGQVLVEALGRAAQLKTLRGVPAQVLPVAVWHAASTGLDLWLSAIAFGAVQVAVLATRDDAPQYVQALREQMAVGQAILSGLGYAGTHLHLLQADSADALDAALHTLPVGKQQVPAQPARFAVAAEKRATLELALDHLMTHAPAARTGAVELPAAGSPFGSLEVNKDTCTLCLSCVSACPSSALQDNPDLPQLRFIEKNCVQCGLCETTCPENAISLVPRLLLTDERKQARVLNETQPYGCVRCGKPFGTLKAIEAMLGKLAGHSMFQGAALERLKMCGDCRVIDIYTAQNESKITDL